MIETKEVEDSLVWADEISELYTGTPAEKMVGLQKNRLLEAIKRVADCTKDLDETLDFLETEYDKE